MNDHREHMRMKSGTRAMTMVLTVSLLPAAAGVSWSMDLQEAVRSALEHRGDVSAAEETVRGSEWSRRGSRYWFLPSIYGSLSFLHYYDVQELEIPGMGSFRMGAEWASHAGVTVDVPLFVPQGPAGFDLASRSLELADAELAATVQDAIFDVIRSFYGLLLAREMVTVSEEGLAIAEEGYRLSAARFEAGAISRFELLQSEVAWENRKPEVIAAHSRYDDAIASLSAALGLDPGRSGGFDIEGCLEDPVPLALPETLDRAREIMRQNSPELTRADRMRGMAEAGVSLARAAFLPSLLFQASWGYQAQRDDSHFTLDDYERDLSVMLSLRIPIMNGLNDISGYASARADRRAAESTALSMTRASELALIRAWNGLQESRERLSATAHTLSQAEEAAEIATVSYEAGTITRLEMDQAFLALTSARTNHASALYGLRLSEAGVARAIGVLDRVVSPGTDVHRPTLTTDEQE